MDVSNNEEDRVVEAALFAIQEFLDTQNWQEAQTVVEQNQQVLLSDTVQGLFDGLIAEMHTQGHSDGATNLSNHQNVLIRCREQGIGPAFEELLVARTDQPPIMQALHALLMAEDIDSARAVIERHQDLLLSDEALEMLDFNITQAEADGDAKTVDVLGQHRTVLEGCREHGIAIMFDEHLHQAATPPPVVEAIQAFLMAKTIADSRVVLEEHQDLLLSDEALEILDQNIVRAEEAGNHQAVELFTDHRTILAQCREHGISHVWESLEFNQLVHQTIEALLGDSGKKEAFQTILEQRQPVNLEEQVFLNAIRAALLGDDLTDAGGGLVSPYDSAWEYIQTGVELRGFPMGLLQQIVENTIAVCTTAPEHRDDWRHDLAELRANLGDEDHPIATLASAILALLDANGDATGLGGELSGIGLQKWSMIVEEIEQRR